MPSLSVPLPINDTNLFSSIIRSIPALAIGRLLIVKLTESLSLALSLSFAVTVSVWSPGETNPRLHVIVPSEGEVKIQFGNNSPSSKYATCDSEPSTSSTNALAITLLVGDKTCPSVGCVMVTSGLTF